MCHLKKEGEPLEHEPGPQAAFILFQIACNKKSPEICKVSNTVVTGHMQLLNCDQSELRCAVGLKYTLDAGDLV